MTRTKSDERCESDIISSKHGDHNATNDIGEQERRAINPGQMTGSLDDTATRPYLRGGGSRWLSRRGRWDGRTANGEDGNPAIYRNQMTQRPSSWSCRRDPPVTWPIKSVDNQKPGFARRSRFWCNHRAGEEEDENRVIRRFQTCTGFPGGWERTFLPLSIFLRKEPPAVRLSYSHITTC